MAKVFKNFGTISTDRNEAGIVGLADYRIPKDIEQMQSYYVSQNY